MTQACAVAFDVFGTLCDGYAKNGPYSRLRDAFGIDKGHFREAAMTRDLSISELIRELVPAEQVEEKNELIKRIEASVELDCRNVFLFSDVVDTMHALRRFNIPYGLISNLAKPYAKPVIELLGSQGVLPPSDLCLWSFREGLIKPSKELFLRFSERVNKSPDQILMIGDNLQNDFIAARLAGCQSRLLMRNLDTEFNRSEVEVITSLSEIHNIIGVDVGFPKLKERPQGLAVLFRNIYDLF